MEFQRNVDSLPLFVSAALSFALAVHGFRRRARSVCAAFAATMAGAGAWSIAGGMELLSVDEATKRTWLSLGLLGTAITQVAFLALVLEYIGKGRWISTRRLALLVFEPAATAFVAWTNPWHHLYWSSFQVGQVGKVYVSEFSPGPLFWTDVFYSYALGVVPLFLLVQQARRARGIYRGQIGLMLVAGVIPWVVHSAEVAGLLPFPRYVDITAASFVLSGLFLLPALTRFQLLDLSPVAKDAVFLGMGDAVVVIDPLGRVADINPAGLTLLGNDSHVNSIVGQAAVEVFRDWPELLGPLQELTDKIWQFESHHQVGQTVWFDSRMWSLDDRGARVGTVLVLRDVTDRWRANQVLIEAAEASEAANRAKSRFLANMSHEVRTPITAVIGYADMLVDPKLEAVDRGIVLQALRLNGRHLLQIVEDILDLSKIEAGKLELELVTCDPWKLVLEVISLLGFQASGKGLRLTAEPRGLIPPQILIDPTRLRQILINLVGNAIKFTPATGRVTIHLTTEMDTADGEPRLRFEVEDEGIGISAEQIRQLFIPFSQADPSTVRKYGGTGLGLSISQQLATAFGGTIEVRSQPGVGSCFIAEFPVRGAIDRSQWIEASALPKVVDKGGPAHDAGTPRFSRTRVLLADDNPDVRRVLVFQLKRLGIDVETATDGRDVVTKALKTSVDLILMDMQMPELNGYGATSALRQNGYTGPIIALTASAMREDRDQALRAGCNDYLSKPIEVSELVSAISRHVDRARTAQMAGPGVHAMPHSTS